MAFMKNYCQPLTYKRTPLVSLMRYLFFLPQHFSCNGVGASARSGMAPRWVEPTVVASSVLVVGMEEK